MALVAVLVALAGAAWGQTFVDLTNGQAVNGTAIADQFPEPNQGTFHTTQYRISVPAGTTVLDVELTFNATAADLDLFLNLGSQVTAGDFDASSESLDSQESIILDTQSTPPVSSGTYYLAIVNYTQAEVPFSILAGYTGGPTSTFTPTPTPTATPTSPPGARQIAVGSTSGAAGSQVSLSVTLDNTLDAAGLELDVAFNGSLLTAGQATLGGAAGAFRVRSHAESGRLRLAMARATGLTGGAGVMLTLPFTINAGASGGTDIPVTVSSTHLYSISGSIAATGVNGQISVTGGGATHTSTPTPTLTPTRTPTPTPTQPGGNTATPTPTTQVGNHLSDINNDGAVDEKDLFILVGDWRKVVPTRTGEPGGASSTLMGRLLHPDDGSGLVGAQMELYDVEGRLLASTSSGAGGAYAFGGLVSGYYRVHASLAGYISDNLYQLVAYGGTCAARDMYLIPGSAGMGSLSGKVVSAINGGGVGSAKVELRSGIGARLGAADKYMTSQGTGAD